MDLTAVSSPGDALRMAARRAPAGPQFLQGSVRFSPLAQESCPGFTASATPRSQRGRRAGAVPSCERGIKMAICIEQKAFWVNAISDGKRGGNSNEIYKWKKSLRLICQKWLFRYVFMHSTLCNGLQMALLDATRVCIINNNNKRDLESHELVPLPEMALLKCWV